MARKKCQRRVLLLVVITALRDDDVLSFTRIYRTVSRHVVRRRSQVRQSTYII